MDIAVEQRVRATHSRFFVSMAMVFVAVTLTGFSTTFFQPLHAGTFKAPTVIYVHAACMFGWITLFLLQTTLVYTRNTPWHRQMGWVGCALAAGIAVSTIAAQVYATRRELAAGSGDMEKAFLLMTCLEMLMVMTLFCVAFANRRRPEIHKRLLVLFTIVILGPAWFRFRHLPMFQSVPHPFVVFGFIADSFILLAIAYDWQTSRRIHPVYLWGGSIVLIKHTADLLLPGTFAFDRLADLVTRVLVT
jgi:hypothetical protein